MNCISPGGDQQQTLIRKNVVILYIGIMMVGYWPNYGIMHWSTSGPVPTPNNMFTVKQLTIINIRQMCSITGPTLCYLIIFFHNYLDIFYQLHTCILFIFNRCECCLNIVKSANHEYNVIHRSLIFFIFLLINLSFLLVFCKIRTVYQQFTKYIAITAGVESMEIVIVNHQWVR